MFFKQNTCRIEYLYIKMVHYIDITIRSNCQIVRIT